MNDSLTKRGKALEEDYFQAREREALERLKQRQEEKERLSPVTGKPMVQKTLYGVVVDQCVDSKGIWLDAGELEQILKVAADQSAGGLSKFFSAVLGRE